MSLAALRGRLLIGSAVRIELKTCAFQRSEASRTTYAVSPKCPPNSKALSKPWATFKRYYDTTPDQNVTTTLGTSTAATSSSDLTKPAVTLLFQNPDTADFDVVLQELPRARASTSAISKAIFLVTPAFANRFSELHAQAMGCIFDSASEDRFESIVGVVDGLSFANDRYRGYEGISVCLSPLDWTEDRVSSGLNDSKPPVVEIFTEQLSDSKTGLPADGSIMRNTYAARVANTLFVNGRQHTLTKHLWRRDSTNKMSLISTVNLSSISIPVQSNAKYPLRCDLVKLTPPQRIVSSMGNVLRLVAPLTGEEPVPASSELERVVPLFLKDLQHKRKSVELRVFALIWPRHLRRGHPEMYSHSQDPKSDQNKAPQLHGIKWTKKLLEFLNSGARLLRVTSGGGGWGKKAGLLSLEPATDFNYDEDHNASGMFAHLELEELTIPTGTTATPIISDGDFVQFFASYHDLARKPHPLRPLQELQDTSNGISHETQRFTIGTMVLPDTLEPTASNWLSTEQVNAEAKEQMLSMGRFGENEVGASNESAASDSLISDGALDNSTRVTTKLPENRNADFDDTKAFTYPHRFGFLTAGPISITKQHYSSSSSDQTILSSTLFDVPNTRFAFTIPSSTKRDSTVLEGQPVKSPRRRRKPRIRMYYWTPPSGTAAVG